jgi:Neuraminidase-like domain/Putative peptidoglycan binding domain/Salmonella virulence plasmid 28.1kDa A protein
MPVGAHLELNSRGDDVRALQRDLQALGLSVPGGELEEGVVGAGTLAAVRQVQAAAGLEPTGVFDVAAAEALGQALLPLQYQLSRVEGRLLSERGTPAGGVTVSLYRRVPGSEPQAMATAITDADGFYRADFPPLEAAAGAAAAIELRVSDAAGVVTPISAPILGPSRHEVVNLVAPAAAVPLAAELDRLAADVQERLGGFGPLIDAVSSTGDAAGDGGGDPLAAAARATGWDARLLALAGAALGLAGRQDLDPRAVYAMVRYGLPADPEQLGAVDVESVRVALSRAVEDGIVALTPSDIQHALAAFNGFATATRRDTPPPGGLSTYGAFLASAGLDDAQQDAFDRVVVRHGDDPHALWAAAATAGIPSEQVARLQVQGKLALLTHHSEPLTRLLMDTVLGPAPDGDGGGGLRALVAADLHTPQAWHAKLVELAGGDDPDRLATVVPPAFAGAASPADAYAAELARRVRLGLPTTVIGRILASGQVHGGTDQVNLGGTLAGMIERAERLGFSFSTTPLGPFLATHGAELTAGLGPADAAAATAELQRLQRLYQITPSDQAFTALARAGVGSAHEIAQLRPQEFAERYGSLFPAPEELDLTYRRARQVAAITYSFFGTSQQLAAPSVYGMSPPAERRDAAVQALKARFPTVAELFGEQDFCACEHCRSVLSPAAYLVDLLHFLDVDKDQWSKLPAPLNAGPTPFAVLNARRPDIAHIPLTCENTNTTLPYIDLANEIMEYRVAKGALDAGAARDTGAASSADLLAEPQYVLDAVYTNVLATARWPLALPFDLWVETVRSYLARVDVDLAGLLDSLRGTDELFAPDPPPAELPPYYRAAVFTEQLGLTPQEVAILTDPAPLDGWFELYGYDATDGAGALAAARTELRSATTLAHRLGVSYVELVELVKTWFVNPNLDTLAALHSIGIEVLDVLRFFGAEGVAPFDDTERASFTAKLAAATAAANQTDFDAATWLHAAWAEGAFNQVLLLADDDAGCSFEHTRLRLAGSPEPADPAADGSLDAVLLRLNLLVRLWRRLGWRLEELDAALRALLPGGRDGLAADALGTGMRTTLVYLAHLAELADRLGLRGRRTDLLALWGDMPTRGPASTYARVFLSPRTGTLDPVFDHPTGAYLTAGAPLADHRAAVQAHLGMSAAEVDAVLAAATLDPATTPLTLGTVSLLFRHRLLARALKLPVADLLALVELSGVDPFHPLHADQPTPATTLPLPPGPDGPPADHPLSGTLEFLDVVEALKAAGLSVAELDYLLRHRFDPVGPFRVDDAAVLRLASETADGLRAIDAEHTPPQDLTPLEDPVTFSDDAVARELGLVLSADVAATTIAMWQRQIVYTATKTHVPDPHHIDPKAIAEFGEVTIDYNLNTETQRLTYRGVPLASRVQAIKQAVPASSVLGELLDDVAGQAEQFRDTALDLLIRAADAETETGTLFGPPPEATGDPAQDAQALEIYEHARRGLLAERVMPAARAALRRRLVTAAVAGSVAGQATGIAPVLTEALVTDPLLLADPAAAGAPLVDAFTSVAAAGLSVTATDASGAAVPLTDQHQTAPAASTDELELPPTVARVALDGYLRVPTAGSYRFVVSFTASADTAELYVGDGPEPLLRATAGGPMDAYLDLRAGVPYRFTLLAAGAPATGTATLGPLAGTVEVSVAGDALPLGPLERLPLLPKAAADRFAHAHLLLTKALRLVGRLGLTERELRWICGHRPDFADLDLGTLPTTPADSGASVGLFGWLRRLLAYVELRADMAGGTDDLVGVFELAHRRLPGSAAASAADAAAKALADLCDRLATLTRRDAATVATVCQQPKLLASATAVGGDYQVDAPGLADERGLRRLWDALVVVERLGLGAAAAIGAATPTPDAGVAQQLRDAVRAHHDLDAWRALARAVNDPLRQRRRDALVAHLLHKLELERVEQLYERLLLDPATEPVVLTSRIRLAISSVQLFIQRCLLSLEQDDAHPDNSVPPAVIDSHRWAWMKRYRVWEANRRIFLFPENWLASELRDDATDLFNALIGALMQGDVTDELAEDAFAAYLQGLAAIARLEIVSVWAEATPNDPEANVLHVIGRDHNAPRSYYYRRFAQKMWTNWEPVGAQIESDHVAAVVYRGWLQVFWVTFLKKSIEPDTGQDTFTGLAGKKPAAHRFQYQAQLHWTELVSGQWTAQSSGDLLTLTIGETPPPPSSDGRPTRKALSLGAAQNSAATAGSSQAPPAPPEFPEQLYAYVVKEVDGHGVDASVIINLRGSGLPGVEGAALRFVSRNGQPAVATVAPMPKAPVQYDRLHPHGLGRNGPLQARDGNDPAPTILAEGRPFTVVAAPQPAPLGSPEASVLANPFFCADEGATSQNTFFVLPSVTEETFIDYGGWLVPPRIGKAMSPGLVKAVPVAPAVAAPARLLTTGALVPPVADPIHPAATHAVAQPADWATDPATVLRVGGRLVGAAGATTAAPATEGR